MRIIFAVILLLFNTEAIAQSWQCDGTVSHGADVNSEERVLLLFENEKVTLAAPDYTYVTGKLQTKNNVSVFAEQEATDLSNERITTSRMFRFDLATGHLVFFDHVADHLLITADCRKN